MAWVRLDDHLDEHDKVLALEGDAPNAMWMNVRALMLCNRKETDGHIPATALGRIGLDWPPARRKKIAARLVEVGFWHEAGHGCDRCPEVDDGWQIHDYTDYQPTRAAKDADRAAARDRMREARAAKHPPPPSEHDDSSQDVRAEHVPKFAESSDNPVPVPVPVVPNGTTLAPDKPARKPRPPDPIFEAIVEACGLDLSEVTDTARGAINRATKELRKVGATPEGIKARADVHRERWPNVDCTPSSLAKNYAQLGAKRDTAVRSVGTGGVA